MSLEIVKALIAIAKLCAIQPDCAKCPLRDYCGKQCQEW